MRSDELDCFPTTTCFSKEEGVEIIQHLSDSSEAFDQYFLNGQQVRYQN